MAMNLSDQSKRFFIVVRHEEATASLVQHEMDLLKVALREVSSKYCMIIHDSDEDKKTGEPMTPHLHLVVFTNKRRTGGKMLNFIADNLACDVLAVSVDKIKDEHLSIRYLGHRDDFDKFPYSLNQVWCNCPAMQEMVRMHFSNDFVELSAVDIIKMIESCNYNRRDILCAIGVSLYNKYRNIINDLLDEGVN